MERLEAFRSMEWSLSGISFAVATFILGLILDLLRSVWMPASTQWLRSKIPHLKKIYNAEKNKETISLYSTLKSSGLSENLIDEIEKEPEKFIKSMTEKLALSEKIEKEYFSENMRSQAEITLESRRLAALATAELKGLEELILSQDVLTEKQKEILLKTQDFWRRFVKSQAQLESSRAEGGTIQSTLYATTLYDLTLKRVVDLKETYLNFRDEL